MSASENAPSDQVPTASSIPLLQSLNANEDSATNSRDTNGPVSSDTLNSLDSDSVEGYLNNIDGAEALNRELTRVSETASIQRQITEAKEGPQGLQKVKTEASLRLNGIKLQDLAWDSPSDPANPQNWSKTKKWFITMTTAFCALVVSFGSSLYTCGILDMAKKGMASREVLLLGLFLYVVGLSFGPMIAAPLSEVFGRKIVYLTTFPLSLIFTLGVGFSNKIREVLVLRFFAGLIGSPALAVCSGTISDMWGIADIEVAMTFFCLAPFMGPVIGPVVGGFAVENENWKWTMWIDLFFGALVLPFLLLVPETYKPIILKHRAMKRGLKIIKPEIPPAEYAKQLFKIYLVKSFSMLIVEPVVLVFSIWSAFIFAVLYGFFESYPVIFQGVYHMSLGISGLAFLGVGIGLFLGAFFYLYLIKFVFFKKNPDGSSPLYQDGIFVPPTPESRLLPAKVGALFLPISLFWVGWSGQTGKIHWIMPMIGGVPFGFGLILIFFSTITYFSLSFPPLSLASAIAANNFLRYALASAFPLFTIQMYRNVHIGWASTIFAFIALVMVPIPWVFEKWGPQLRKKSKYGYYAVMKAEKEQKELQKKKEEELQKILNDSEEKHASANSHQRVNDENGEEVASISSSMNDDTNNAQKEVSSESVEHQV